MEEEVPGNGGWAKDGEAEEPARVAGTSAAGRESQSVRGGIINQEFKG